MAEGFSLGKAYVTVSPDTEGFKDKLKAELDKDKTEVKVKVTPDATDFKTRLDKSLATARNAKVTVKTDADTTAFSAKIDAAVKRASGKNTAVKIQADTKSFDAKLDASLKKPRSTTVNIKYDKSQISEAGAGAGGIFTKAFGGAVGGGGGGGGSAAADAGGLGPVAVGGIAAGVVSALAILPATIAASGALAGGALGAGILYATDAKFKAGVGQLGSQIKDEVTSALKDSGLQGALENSLGQASAIITRLGPELAHTFGGVAPLIRPMVNMFGDLVTRTLPGLNYLISASEGPLTRFFNAAGKIIGTNLSGFFRQLAPGVNASVYDLTALLRVVTGILPPLAHFASGVAIVVQQTLELPNKLQQVTNAVGNLGAKLNIPAPHKTGLQTLSDGLSWLEKHIPAGNKSITDLLGVTGRVTPVANRAGTSMRTMGNVVAQLVGQINKDVSATDRARTAWTSFINTMTGSFGSLRTVRQDMSTLAGDITKVKGSYDGSSRAALNYHADLDQAINDSNSYITKLREQNAAAGNTKRSQQALSNGIKGTIAQLIPAAKHSATARAEVLGLARANGINASSFQDLTKKVGSSTTATQRMNGATNTLTRSSGGAINQNVVLKKAFDNLTTSMHWSKAKADDLKKSIQNLPKSKQIKILESISGKGSVRISASGYAPGITYGKPSIPKSEALLGVGGAGGGVLPGYAPGRDVVDAKLAPGEGVLVPEAVRYIGPETVQTLNSMFQNRKSKGLRFAGGGLVNGSLSGTNVATGNRNLIADTVKYTEPIIAEATKKLAESVAKSITESAVKYKAGAGVQQWRPDVLKALALLGMPASLANRVLYQMQTESGGNPNAVNLWDSNAKAGHPSQGLMQVIPGTFAAYHVAGTSMNIRDPLANIAAAINYARHVYGPSLGALGSGHGYANGGYPTKGEIAWVGEHGPELVHFGSNAHVYTAKQSQAILNQANSVMHGVANISTGLYSGGTVSTSKVNTAISKAMSAIEKYYKGSSAKSLENIMTNAGHRLDWYAGKINSITAKINNAKSYYNDTYSSLSSYGQLSNLGITTFMGDQSEGSQIQTALQSKVNSLKKFDNILSKAAKSKLSTAFIADAVSLGPDQGYEYINAVLNSPNLIKSINSLYAQETTYEKQIARRATDISYDRAATGQSFLGDLYSTETSFINSMKSIESAINSVTSKALVKPVVKGHANGGMAYAGEIARVGETGPETVVFGQDARVLTAAQSAAAGGVHFHEGAIQVKGRMTASDVAELKRQLADAVSGFNI